MRLARRFGFVIAVALVATLGRAQAGEAAGTPFEQGRLLFQARAVPHGDQESPLVGLGPTYNIEGCEGCHPGNGRGRPPSRLGEPLGQMIVRLSIEEGGEIKPHPAYGVQLNDRAIPGATAEGRVFAEYSAVKGRYGDGTPFTLLRPHYGFLDMAFGRLDDDVLMTARLPPAVTGLGRLEAVPDSAILALADPEDLDGDGISGRPNWVPDIAASTPRLGRFGWKASQPSLRQQVADAARIDMGLTSSVFPLEDCPIAQEHCIGFSADRWLELSDQALATLTAYLAALPPPARGRRSISSDRGELLFAEFGCARCHVPSLPTNGKETADGKETAEIAAYTDLLLHDLGPGLADGRPDHAASGSEWRTAPLSGIGQGETVRYLHDGRARDLPEAILWHGGEASVARERFRVARQADRNALIDFLKSR